MRRAAIVLACAVALAGTAPAATSVPHGPVSINLPGDAGMVFKPGPGLIVAQTYCLTCHSSAYVSTQPVLSRAQWTAEVTKMRNVYGASIPTERVQPIVEYLTVTYGKP